MITKKILLTFLSLIAISNQTPIECGVAYTPSGNVHGGQTIGRFDYPWKAALMELSDDGVEYKYICGGILIDDTTVLTAAHCLRQRIDKTVLARDLTIGLGVHNISNKIEPGRYFAPVKSIKVHDNWNPATPDFDGDIAVIKLTKPVILDEYIRPVCLVTKALLSIKNGSVVGWGIYDDTGVVSNLPRNIDIPIVNDRECFRKDNLLARIIWNEAFCAGKEGGGVCKGDSGSGYYISDNGKFYLRGIVSSSVVRPCSEANLALFSDVFLYMNFIEKFVDEKTKIELGKIIGEEEVSEENFGQSYEPNFSDEVVTVNGNCRSYEDDIGKGVSCTINDFDLASPKVWIKIASEELQRKVSTTLLDVVMKPPYLTFVPRIARAAKLRSLFIEGHGTNYDGQVKLSDESLSFYKELRKLILITKRIDFLPQNLLQDLKYLKEINLSFNHIESIPENFFRNNVKLEQIHMSHNKIKALPENLLQNLKSLKELHLWDNQIASIPENFLKNNEKLERIQLKQNKIKKLPEIIQNDSKLMSKIEI